MALAGRYIKVKYAQPLNWCVGLRRESGVEIIEAGGGAEGLAWWGWTRNPSGECGSAEGSVGRELLLTDPS